MRDGMTEIREDSDLIERRKDHVLRKRVDDLLNDVRDLHGQMPMMEDSDVEVAHRQFLQYVDMVWERLLESRNLRNCSAEDVLDEVRRKLYGITPSSRGWLFEGNAQKELSRALEECEREHGGDAHNQPTMLKRTITRGDGSELEGTVLFVPDDDGWWEEYARANGWIQLTTDRMIELFGVKNGERASGASQSRGDEQ